MKTVILAGGFGTRIADVDSTIPKPLIKINDKPLLWHILKHYSKFGFNDFIIAGGYKIDKIKEYFLNLDYLNNDFEINYVNNKIKILSKIKKKKWKVSIVDTGKNSMTGGRILRLKKYLKDEKNFMVTYGDGLCDVNIKHLLKFHISHKKICSVTAVRPQARFGELQIKNKKVVKFKEKPQVQDGRINGGYFVFTNKIFDYLENTQTILEKEPLENLSKSYNLMAFNHDGFWHCVDTKRDLESLEKIITNE
jgi:glucose-1-phosphate cytidylyltransferase